MSSQKSTKKSAQVELSKEIRNLVHELDDLYYKKPAGYFGYIITCMSTMQVPMGMLEKQKMSPKKIKK